MINMIIVHITDVHIKGHSEELLRRASSIGSALAANFEAGRSVAIAISGDLAWEGKPAQYDFAEKFISACIEALSRAGFKYVGLAVAPGNHDCDFDLQDEHERLALWTGAQDLCNSLSLFKSLSTVQKPFEDFVYLAGVNSTTLTPLLARSQFSTTGGVLNIDALNTSWGTIKDKTEGHLPFAEIEIPRCGDNVISVLIAHHPPNWFLQEHKAALQRWIDETYDIVLYGHEHYNDEAERRNRHTGAAVTIVIGSAFYTPESPNGFSVLSFEGVEETWLTQATFRWDDSRFVLQGQLGRKLFSCNPAKLRPKRSFTKSFQLDLEDPGLQLTHPQITRQIRLGEIYVEPRLNNSSVESSSDLDFSNSIPSSRLLDDPQRSGEGRLTFVFGQEQCGKTAMCKQLCLAAQAQGKVPLLLNVGDLSSANAGEITAWINRAVTSSYVGGCDVFYQAEPIERVIFLDGLERLKGKHNAKLALVDKCKALASTVIVTMSASSASEGVLSLTRGVQKLPEGEIYEFAPLSKSGTMDLLKRWYLLGRLTTSGEVDIDALCRQVAARISVMLGKHGLPPYPLSVLLLLQLGESLKESTAIVADGSFGYIMEALIVDELQHSPLCVSLGIAIGYLGQFAWYLEERNLISVDEGEFSTFHDRFAAEQGLTVDESKLKRDLSAARFLTVSPGVVRFRYPYLFHYFLANHLSVIHSTPAGARVVDYLIRYVHTDKAASVLTFLAHFSGEPDLVEKLIARALGIQASSSPVDFWRDSSVFARFQSKEERERLLAYESEDAETEVGDDELTPHAGGNGNGELTQAEMFPEGEDPLGWASSLKLIHILGQVLRSRSARMDVAQKRRVIECCVAVARKTLGFAFFELEKDAPALVHATSSAFEELLQANREKALRHANSMLGWLVVALSCTYIFRVGRACGAEEFTALNSQIFTSSTEKTDRLFLLAARMLGERVIVEGELIKMFEEASISDLLPTAIIRRLARYRLHIAPPDDVQRRRIARKLRLGQTPRAISLQQKDIAPQVE